MASPAPRPVARALLGAGVVLGWLAHDFVVFLPAGDPATSLALVPGSLVALVLGAAGGLALRSWAAWLALTAVAAAASAATAVFDLPLSRSAEVWLPRFAFLGCAAYGLARVLHGSAGRGRGGAPWTGPLRCGLGAGVVAVVVATAYRGELVPASYALLAAAALALVAGRPERRAARVAGTLGAALLPAVPVALGVREDLAPTRGDLSPPAARAAAGRANLLLVVLDTARADRMGVHGAPRDTTPVLDRFATEHAVLHTQAAATSPWTWPSHASLLTGLSPGEHEDPGAIGPATPTLAERLRAAGYRTAAIVANAAQLRPDTGIDRGFEHYDDRKGAFVGGYVALAQAAGAAPRAGILIYRDATRITDLALGWLDRRPEGPFFLLLNYQDPHFPYVPPPPYDEAFGPEQPVDPLDPGGELRPLVYDRELRYLDAELGRLLEGLRARGVFDDTVIVVTSDHGESLGDRGFWLHGWNLYQELVHVPLLVKPAGPRLCAVDETPLSGADVHGLVLEALGFDGRRRDDLPTNLAEWYFDRHRVAWWEAMLGKELRHDLLSWREGDLKLIVSSTGAVEAYDLARDPDEGEPVELAPERAAAARAWAEAWWAEHRRDEAPPPALPEGETAERLRALGYGG